METPCNDKASKSINKICKYFEHKFSFKNGLSIFLVEYDPMLIEPLTPKPETKLFDIETIVVLHFFSMSDVRSQLICISIISIDVNCYLPSIYV